MIRRTLSARSDQTGVDFNHVGCSGFGVIGALTSITRMLTALLSHHSNDSKIFPMEPQGSASRDALNAGVFWNSYSKQAFAKRRQPVIDR